MKTNMANYRNQSYVKIEYKERKKGRKERKEGSLGDFVDFIAIIADTFVAYIHFQ